MPALKHIISFFSIILLFSSCFKFDGDQTVPTYLVVPNSYKVVPNPALNGEEGSMSCNIVDTKAVVDENVIGNFELPATFPVLFEGANHIIRLRPGIKMNGIGNARISYPFYKPVELSNINLLLGQYTIIPDSLLKVSYVDDAVFPFKENFEGSGMLFELPMEKTNTGVYEGTYSGHIHLYRGSDSSDAFDVKSTTTFMLPSNLNNKESFWEMDFKCDKQVQVGLYVSGVGSVYSLTLNPTSVWKKIYINVTPIFNIYNQDGVTEYKLQMKGQLDGGETQADFYFDNIKIVHHKGL